MVVPLPLLLAGPAVLGAVGLAMGIKRTLELKKLADNRVAILGDHKVGKSTLLATLSRPSRSKELSTLTDRGGGEFTLEVGGKMVTFDVPADLPGANPLTSPDWKPAIQNANHVWYVFRADRVAKGDHRDLATIDAHLHFIEKWRSKSHPPKVMLIGTWADADPGWSEDTGRFIRRVSETHTIKLARIKMGNAPLVVGSLSTEASARELERQIRKRLE